MIEVNEATTFVMRQDESMRVLVWHTENYKERGQREENRVKEALDFLLVLGALKGACMSQGGGNILSCGSFRSSLGDPRIDL